jgi:hypothetical protein
MELFSQEKYVADLLERVNMKNCRPVATPLSTSEKLSLEGHTRLGEEGSLNYRTVVGALRYITLTRPDLAFL